MPSTSGLDVRIDPVERTTTPLNFFQAMARAASGTGRGGRGSGNSNAPMIDYMVDPNTGQLVPIVGRSDKMRELNMENMNQYRARMALFGDGSEENPGDTSIREKLADFDNMSVERQAEVIADIRRTDIPRLAQATGLNPQYFINLALNDVEGRHAEQTAAIRQQGAAGTFFDSMRIGFRGFVDGVQDLFSDSAEQLARAEQRQDYIARITNENAVLRNRALRQAEGAGFLDRAGSSLTDELAASAGEFVGASAPMFAGAGVGGLAARLAVGRVAGAAAGGAAGAAADAAAVANRLRALNRATTIGSSIGGAATGAPMQLNATVDMIANNPDLTDEQKQQALDEAYGPSVAFGTGLGAITMPFGAPASRWLAGRRALAGRGSSNVAQAVRARRAANGQLPAGVTNPNYWDDVIHNARMKDYALENAGLMTRTGAYIRSMPDTAFESGLLGGAMQLGTNVIANESMGIENYDPMENVGTATLMGVASSPVLNVFNMRRLRPIDGVRVDNQGRMTTYGTDADGNAVSSVEIPRELTGVPQFSRGVDNQLQQYVAPTSEAAPQAAEPQTVGLGGRPRPSSEWTEGQHWRDRYTPNTPEYARAISMSGTTGRARQAAAEGFGFGPDILRRATVLPMPDTTIRPFTQEWAAANAARADADAGEFGFGTDPLQTMGMSDPVTPPPAEVWAPSTRGWDDPTYRANRAREEMEGFGFGPDILRTAGQGGPLESPRGLSIDWAPRLEDIREKPIYQTMSKGQRQRRRQQYVNAKRLRQAQFDRAMVDTGNEGFAPREPRLSGRDLVAEETGTRRDTTAERQSRRNAINRRAETRDPVNSLVREVRRSSGSDESVMQAVDDAIARATADPAMALTNLSDLLRGIRQSAEAQRGRGTGAAKELERLDYAEGALLDAADALAGTEYRVPDRSRNIRGPLDLPQGTTPEVVAVFDGARANGKGGNITLDQARANMTQLVDAATLGENGVTGTGQIIANVERFLDAPNVGNYFNKRQRGLLLFASNRARALQLERMRATNAEFGFGNTLERYGQEVVDHSEFGFGPDILQQATVLPAYGRPNFSAMAGSRANVESPDVFGFGPDILRRAGYPLVPETPARNEAVPIEPGEFGFGPDILRSAGGPIPAEPQPIRQRPVQHSQADLLEMSPSRRARAIRAQTNTNAIQRAREAGALREPQPVATELRDPTADTRVQDRPARGEERTHAGRTPARGTSDSTRLDRQFSRERAELAQWLQTDTDDRFIARMDNIIETARSFPTEQERVDYLGSLLLDLNGGRLFQRAGIDPATVPESVFDRVELGQAMVMDALETIVHGAPRTRVAERPRGLSNALDLPGVTSQTRDVFSGALDNGRGGNVTLERAYANMDALVDNALSSPEARTNARQIVDNADRVLDAPNVKNFYNKRQRALLAHARQRARQYDMARELEERQEFGFTDVLSSYGEERTLTPLTREWAEANAARTDANAAEFGFGDSVLTGAYRTLGEVYPASARNITTNVPGRAIRNRMDGISQADVAPEALAAFNDVTSGWVQAHRDIDNADIANAMRLHLENDVLPNMSQDSQFQLLEMLRSREEASPGSYKKVFYNQRTRDAIRSAIDTIESRPFAYSTENTNAISTTADPNATSGGQRQTASVEPVERAGEGSAAGENTAGDSGAQTGTEGSAPATPAPDNADAGTSGTAAAGRGDAGTPAPDTGAAPEAEAAPATEAPATGEVADGERGAGTTAPVDATTSQSAGSTGTEGSAGESGSGDVAGTRGNTEPGSVDGSGSDKQVVAPETPVTPNEGGESLTSTPEVMDGLARVINDANAKLTAPAEAAPAPAQSQTRTTTRKRAPRAAKTTAVGPEEMTVQKPTRNGKWDTDEELLDYFVEPAYDGRGKSRKWKGTAVNIGAYSREYSEGITNARLYRYADDPYELGGPSVLLHFYNNGTDNSAKVYEVGLHASADFEGWTAKNSRDFPERWEWFPDNDTDAGFVTYDRGRLIFDPSKAGDELRTLLGQRNTRMGVEFRSRDGEHVFAEPDEFQIPTWYLLDNGRLPAQDMQGRRTSAELAADAQAPLVNTDEVAPNSPTTLAQVEATAEAANTSAKKKGGKKAGVVNKTPVRQEAVQKATAQDGPIQTDSGPFKGDDVEPVTNNADKTTEQALQEAAAENVAKQTRKVVKGGKRKTAAKKATPEADAATLLAEAEAHYAAMPRAELEAEIAQMRSRNDPAEMNQRVLAERALKRMVDAENANPNAIVHDTLNNGPQDRTGTDAILRELPSDEASLRASRDTLDAQLAERTEALNKAKRKNATPDEQAQVDALTGEVQALRAQRAALDNLLTANERVFTPGSQPAPRISGDVMADARRLLTNPETNKGAQANQLATFLKAARLNQFKKVANAQRMTENTPGNPNGIADVDNLMGTMREVLGTDALRKAGFIDASPRVNGIADAAQVLYARGVPEFAVTGRDLETARALRKQGLTDADIVDSLFGASPEAQQGTVMQNRNKGVCD